MVAFILDSFLGSLRGEDVVKMVLGETKEYFVLDMSNITYKHVVLPLRGRFKREMGRDTIW